MLTFISLSFSLLSLVLVCLFYWRVRKKQEMTVDNLSNRVSNLLSEFNSVSANNIELLEERTEELRRTTELADMKIKKINRLLDQLQGAKKRLQQVKEKSEDGETTFSSRRERVLSLSEQGYSVEEIAEKTGLKRGEVDVIVKFNRSRLAGL